MPDLPVSKTQKPRCRQRQRGSKTKKGTNTTANPSYVLRKFFFPHLLYIVYQIFRLAQIFVGFFSRSADDGNRHSMQHPAAGTIFVSWHSESGIPPAAFHTISSLYRYRRAKPPTRHCTSFRLDRPALSRSPYLLYMANLRLPFANNLSSQAPSAPVTTFHEPQTNKQKNIQKNHQKNLLSPQKKVSSTKKRSQPRLAGLTRLLKRFQKVKNNRVSAKNGWRRYWVD